MTIARKLAVATASLVLGTAVQAGPTTIMAEAFASPGQATTIGTGFDVYNLLDFVDPADGAEPAKSAVSDPGGHVVEFKGQGGVDLPANLMHVGEVTTTDEDWWSGSDDSFYFSDFGFDWLEIFLPTNTVAFSFTLDANTAANAWAVAIDDAGYGVDTFNRTYAPGTINDPNDVPFDITLRNGVAESFGFYAANSTAGQCNTIDRVIVDPKYWGIGDFGITVDDDACSTSVPAPAPVAMLGLALLGLLGTRTLRSRRARIA